MFWKQVKRVLCFHQDDADALGSSVSNYKHVLTPAGGPQPTATRAVSRSTVVEVSSPTAARPSPTPPARTEGDSFSFETSMLSHGAGADNSSAHEAKKSAVEQQLVHAHATPAYPAQAYVSAAAAAAHLLSAERPAGDDSVQPQSPTLHPPLPLQLSLAFAADTEQPFVYLEEQCCQSTSASHLSSLTDTQTTGLSLYASGTESPECLRTLSQLHLACKTIRSSFGSTRVLQNLERHRLVKCATAAGTPPPRLPLPTPSSPANGSSRPQAALNGLGSCSSGQCGTYATCSRAASSTYPTSSPQRRSLGELKEALRSLHGDSRLAPSTAPQVMEGLQRKVSGFEAMANVVQLYTGGSASPLGDARSYVKQHKQQQQPVPGARREAAVAGAMQLREWAKGASSANACQSNLSSTQSLPNASMLNKLLPLLPALMASNSTHT